MAKYKFAKNQFGENCSVSYEENGHRYSVPITGSDCTSNIDYVKQTIDKMFELCNKGMIISLSSDKYDLDNQITFNAGEIASWAISKYDLVAVDHTTDTNQFLVIIYKN